MASISAETKIHAVEQCYAGAGSLNQIAERFGVHRSTLGYLVDYHTSEEISKYIPEQRISIHEGFLKKLLDIDNRIFP